MFPVGFHCCIHSGSILSFILFQSPCTTETFIFILLLRLLPLRISYRLSVWVLLFLRFIGIFKLICLLPVNFCSASSCIENLLSVSHLHPDDYDFEVKAYASTNTVCTILSIVLAVCALVFGIGFLPSLVVCLIWIVNQSVYCKEALKYSKAGTKISWWKRRRTGNGKLFGDYCCADYLFLHQEKKANSSGCVADTKSMYRIFIVEDDEIIARTVKSHLETMSDELRKSTIFH